MLYTVESKVSVISVGLAVHCLNIANGAVSDKQIMVDYIRTHSELTKKQDAALLLPNNGSFHEHYPRNWKISMDKGYQGMLDSCRTITPKKKTRNVPLSFSLTS